MRSTGQKKKSKVGAGRNRTRLNEQVYKKGTLMFIEGEQSTEMFIIRAGSVRILKQEGDKTVELAVLGKGSVLGELSLLDHQPRSATAQIVEDVTATVIDESTFNKTMKSIPSWLANIIQVIVTRLRNTMKRSSDSIVQKSVAGVIKILLLLYKNESVEKDGVKRISLTRAKEAIASTIGIGEMETENVLLHLILKETILINKDINGTEFITVIDPEVLTIYMNFLRASQRGAKLLGEDLPDNAVDLIQVITETGNKNGSLVRPGIKKIGVPQLEIELQRQGKGKNIDLDALDNLVDAKIILKEQSAVTTAHQTHKQTALIYNENTLKKVMALHIWLTKFKEEIIF